MLGLKALGDSELVIMIWNTQPHFVTYVERHVPWCYMEADGSFRVPVGFKKEMFENLEFYAYF